MRQYRGCSHLYYALVTEAADGTATYGTPKQLAPVKSVSREISGDNEKVYADNVVQQETFAANTITRTFETTRISAEVVAELMGNTEVTIGSGTSATKGYATKADGSARPYIAVGYALHDGDIDNPCELVWAYKGKVVSISKTSNTIDDGTGSEGQSVEISFVAPKKPFTTTGERNLDFVYPLSGTDSAATVTAFFSAVVTPDNAATVLA
jgi:phi13 family phage major tail protein